MLSVSIHLRAFRAGIVQIVVFWVLTQFQSNMLPQSSQMTELPSGRHCSNSFNSEDRGSTFLQNIALNPRTTYTLSKCRRLSSGYVYCKMLNAFRAMVAVHVLCHALHLLLIKSHVFDAGLRARPPCCQLSSE